MRTKRSGKRLIALILVLSLCVGLLAQTFVSADKGDGNQYWKVETELTVNGSAPVADADGYIKIPKNAEVSFRHSLVKIGNAASLEELYDISFDITLPKEIDDLLTADDGSISWQEMQVGANKYYLFGEDADTRPAGVDSDDGKSVTYTLSLTPEFIAAAVAEKLTMTEAGTTFNFKASEEVTVKSTIDDESSTSIDFKEEEPTPTPNGTYQKQCNGSYRLIDGKMMQVSNNSVSEGLGSTLQEGDYIQYAYVLDGGLELEAGELVDVFCSDVYTFVGVTESTDNGAGDRATSDIWQEDTTNVKLTEFVTYLASKAGYEPASKYNFTCYSNKDKITTTRKTTYYIWLKYTPSAAIKELIETPADNYEIESAANETLNWLIANHYYKIDGSLGSIKGINIRPFFDPELYLSATDAYTGAVSAGTATPGNVDFTGSTRRSLGGMYSTVTAKSYTKTAVAKGDYVTYCIRMERDKFSSPCRVDKVYVYLPKGLEMVTSGGTPGFTRDVNGTTSYIDGTTAAMNTEGVCYVHPTRVATNVKPNSGMKFGNDIVNALFARGYDVYEIDLTSGIDGTLVTGAEEIFFSVYVNTDLGDIMDDLANAGLTLDLETMTEDELRMVYTYGMLTMAEIAEDSIYSTEDVVMGSKTIPAGTSVIDDDAVNDMNPFNDYFQYSLVNGWSNGYYLKTSDDKSDTLAECVNGTEPLQKAKATDHANGERDGRADRSIFSHARHGNYLSYFKGSNRDEDDYDVAMICSPYLTQEENISKIIVNDTASWMTGTLKTFIDTNPEGLAWDDVVKDGVVTKVGQVIAYKVTINQYGAENLSNLSLVDSLSAGMSFVTDGSDVPYVNIVQVLQDEKYRQTGYNAAGDPVSFINYSFDRQYPVVKNLGSLDFVTSTGVTVPGGLIDGKWDCTVNSDKNQLTINFGDVGNATYEIYYLARVDKISPTYTNKAEMKGDILGDSSASAKYKTSGSYALGHGKSVSDVDYEENEITYKLNLALTGSFAVDTFTMEDAITSLGIPGNASLVGDIKVINNSTSAATEDIKAVATTDDDGYFKSILIHNEKELISVNGYSVTFTVKYQKIPYGSVVKNEFGTDTTTVDYPLNLQVTKQDSVSNAGLTGAKFALYYSYTDETTNVPVLCGINNSTTPVTLETAGASGIGATGKFLLDSAKASSGVWSLKLVETQAPGGYDLPSNPVTELTVTKTNNGYVWTTDGTSITTNDDNLLQVLIKNTRTPGNASAELNKVLYDADGTAITSNMPEFTFTATRTDSENGSVTYSGGSIAKDGTLTLKNTAAGVIAFPALTFTSAGTYTFDVVESALTGITTDTNTITVTFTVSDELAATIGYSKSAKLGEEADSAFVNKIDPVSIQLGAEKIYKDAFDKQLEIPADMFGFTASIAKDAATGIDLTGITYAEVDDKIVFSAGNAAGTDSAAALVAFPELSFTAEGTYTFEIAEIAGANSGITYDENTYNAVVVVTKDRASGALLATVSYNYKLDDAQQVPVFTNHNKPTPPSTSDKPASVTLSVKKTLDGKTPTNEEFYFELISESGAVLETVKNNGGTATFSTLRFEEADTFTYTIREVVETGDGYRYDHSVYTAIVTVTKSSNSYQASVRYTKDGESHTGTLLFANETIEETTPVSVRKVWNVAAGFATPSEVTVALYGDGKLEETVTLNSANNWSYEWEKLDAKVAWTVDELDVPAGYVKSVTGSETSYTITNTYTGNVPTGDGVSAAFSATKTLNGAAPGSNPFRFTLTNNRGNVVQTVGVNADGLILFDAINFTQAGTYTFTIAEVVRDRSFITYDTATFRAVVTVSEQNGTLVAEVSYPDGAVTFNNTTGTPGGEEPFVEIDEDGTPLGTWEPDGDTWVFIEDPGTPLGNLPHTGANTPLVAVTAGILLLLLGVMLASKKREDNVQ